MGHPSGKASVPLLGRNSWLLEIGREFSGCPLKTCSSKSTFKFMAVAIVMIFHFCENLEKIHTFILDGCKCPIHAACLENKKLKTNKQQQKSG